MNFSNLITKKIFLRKKMNHMRKHISYRYKHMSSVAVTKNALNYLPIKKAKNIALFFSINGELNTYSLIYELLKNKKKIYLPVIHPFSFNQLLFIRYNYFTKLKINRLKIPEPKLNITDLIPLKLLDVIIMPILAFDHYGNRLGMGGGFYDRTLQNNDQYKLLLIGLAYDFQRVPKLEKENWDVSLSSIITPYKIYSCCKKKVIFDHFI